MGKKILEDLIIRDIVLSDISGNSLTRPKYCGYSKSESVLEDLLWEYAEGTMETKEDKKMLSTHIDACEYCTMKLFNIQKAIILSEQEKVRPIEKALKLIKKKQREKIIFEITKNFEWLNKKSSTRVKNFIEDIKSRVTEMFSQSLNFPTPQLDAVFGDPVIRVYSPFGKVRFPIIFEWEPIENAEAYIISIRKINWFQQTKNTRFVLDHLLPGMEYELDYTYEIQAKIQNQDTAIDGAVKDIELCSEAEIDELMEIKNFVDQIDAPLEKILIWAAILEEKEFYLEAIQNYLMAFKIEPNMGIGYRIACCYEELEEDDLKVEWNNKIIQSNKQNQGPDFENE